MTVLGRYKKQFRVTHTVPTAKQAQTTDDMPVQDWMRGDELTQTITYIGDIERWDAKWKVVLQWVDLDERGHRIVLPHGVVERIITHADKIMELARSDRSRTAATTRRENGASQ